MSSENKASQLDTADGERQVQSMLQAFQCCEKGALYLPSLLSAAAWAAEALLRTEAGTPEALES